MTQPTFVRAKAYNRGGFVDNISNANASDPETFDVGSGAGDLCVVARVVSTGGSIADDISSFVFGGVTLTALTQEALPIYIAKQRFFYGLALGLTGGQAWTATLAGAAGQVQVTLYAARGVTALNWGTLFNVSGETLNEAVATNANSVAVGFVSVSNSGSGVNAPTAPTVEREDRVTGSVFITPYVAERPGAGSSVNLQVSSTGNSFFPGFIGRAVSLEGTAPEGPVLTSPTAAATGNTAATVGATTDTASGTMYALPRIGGSAASAATIVATGTSLSISSTGAKSIPLTGLTAGSTYVADICHAGSSNSNVVTTGSFTPTVLATSGSLSAQAGTAGAAFTWTGATPESQITTVGIGSRTWTASGLGASGLTINSSTGVLSGTCGTAGSYTITATNTDSSTAGTNPTGGGSPPQTVVRTINLTITDPPSITSTGSGSTNGPFGANCAENSTAACITLTADQAVTWGTLGGADAALFAKASVTGTTVQLVPLAAFNFESLPHANPFVVTVPATGSAGNLRTVTVNVTVTNVTELPGTPTIGTAVGGNASASVAFTPPAAGTAPTITGYTATSSPSGITGTGASSPITVSGLTNGTAYTFTVTASNSDGTGSASAASNSVTPSVGPTINTQPTAQTAKIGATATFTAAATASTAPLTAQWQKDGVNISGATNTTSYARSGVVLADHGGMFRCTYSDAAGGPVFTNAAALTVAVTFINGPVPAQSGSVGSAASWDFSSFFAGGLSRTFSILLGALPAGMAQVGATAVFSGTPTTASSGTLVISSTDSATNSDLTGTISWTISSAGTAPVITVQPANQSVTAGNTASFSVTATGSGLTYQWRRNGTDISGATSSTYTTPTTTVSGGLANSGDLYSVVVTGDTSPAATSSNAELTVTAGAGATIISSALKNNEGWVHALAPFKGYLRDLSTGTLLLTKTGLTSNQDGTLGFFDVSLVVGADYELRWDRTDTGERGWEVLRAI